MAGEIDPDGDSQMHSSASSSSDEMFPEENAPATPQTGPSMPGVAEAELSPPNSQERGAALAAQMLPPLPASQDAMDTNQARPAKNAGKGGGAAGATKGKDAEKLPGWGWQNPKAVEDYERSLEMVLDQGFNLRDFGEPFDEKDIPQESDMKG